MTLNKYFPVMIGICTCISCTQTSRPKPNNDIYDNKQKANKQSLLNTTGNVIPVTLVRVQKTGLKTTAQATGFVEATQKTYLSFKRDGVVTNIFHKKNGNPLNVGDFVKKGQIIAKLSKEQQKKQEKLAIQKAKLAIKQAEISLESAKADFLRADKLHQAGAISKNRFNQTDRDYRTAKLTLAREKNQLAETQAKTIEGNIIAPTSGVVSAINIAVGEYVKPLPSSQARNNPSASHITLVNNKNLKIMTSVPYETAIQLKMGSNVKINKHSKSMQSVSLSQSNHNKNKASLQENINATISNINFSSNNKNDFASIILKIAPRYSHFLKIGEKVTIMFTLKNKPDAITVPLNTVITDSQKSYVYKVNPDNKVTFQPVLLGEISPYGVEIKQGLSVNDLIVNKGKSRVSEGTAVRPIQQLTSSNHASSQTGIS